MDPRYQQPWYWFSSPSEYSSLRTCITKRVNEYDRKKPGPRFNNIFSIAIQIRWEFCYSLTLILTQWLLQSFVHSTTAVCAKMCCDLMARNGIIARQSFPRIWIAGKKLSVKLAPEYCSSEQRYLVCSLYPGYQIHTRPWLDNQQRKMYHYSVHYYIKYIWVKT